MSDKPPAIKVRGIRSPIPQGYLLGRTDSGEGDVQLIHTKNLINQAAAQAVQQILTIINQQKTSVQGATPLVLDGQDGEDGWTIPGPQGSAGPIGAQGVPGIDGQDGEDGMIVPSTLGQDSRIRLTAPTTFFVNVSIGDDSNDGTSTRPWKTLSNAYSNLQKKFDLGGQNITVQCQAGTFTTGLQADGPLFGLGSVLFLGDTVTPANVIINPSAGNAVRLRYGAIISFAGFQVTASTNDVIRVEAGSHFLLTGNCNFAATPGFHFFVLGGTASLATSYNITGGAVSHFAVSGGTLRAISPLSTATVTGTPAFNNGFVDAQNAGLVDSQFLNFSGAATGPRYTAFANGVIFIAGGGANYFPGNAAGSTSTGGQYS